MIVFERLGKYAGGVVMVNPNDEQLLAVYRVTDHYKEHGIFLFEERFLLAFHEVYPGQEYPSIDFSWAE